MSTQLIWNLWKTWQSHFFSEWLMPCFHPKSTDGLLLRRLSRGFHMIILPSCKYSKSQSHQIGLGTWMTPDEQRAKLPWNQKQKKRRKEQTRCWYRVSYHFLLQTLHTNLRLDSGTFLPGRFLPALTLTNRPDFLKPETPSAKEAQQHLHEYRDSQGLRQKSGH